MRTTIDIPDDIRAKLLELAARRGQKGFSGLVQEAVTRYLEAERQRAAVLEKAQAVLGGLGDTEADELDAAVTALRGRWR
jgi:predicted transcriptional regulator